jgi:hypothetical protein
VTTLEERGGSVTLGAHSPFLIAANYRRLVQEAEPKVMAQQQDALPDSKPQSQPDRCHPPNGCSAGQARSRAAEPPATPFAMVRDRPRNNDAPTSVANPGPRASAPKNGSMTAPLKGRNPRYILDPYWAEQHKHAIHARSAAVQKSLVIGNVV